MSVVIETTLGDITVDLFLDQRPVTCLNFLKLCKMKYYNFNLFHSIRSGFIAQTGDPTGEGSGGESIFGILEGPEKRFFSGEKMPKIRHTDTGMLSMVGTGDMMIGSQFFFTLGSDLDSLDGHHCVIGEVTEGQEVLRKLNEVICDETHRPYQDVRITHTVILEDPYADPTGFRAPSRSPSPSAERLRGGRIAPDEELDDTQGKSAQEIQEMIEEKEAKARATILEMVGDLPDADIAPPENILFVCKLNPVTTDEDLEIIFSRFGKIVSCEVIRDKKTGDSLQYAFIEFSDKQSCEDAYFKMDNVLIDDRRIHVDFSQSVSKIKWLGKGRGVKHLTDEDVRREKYGEKDKKLQPRSKEQDRGRHGRKIDCDENGESEDNRKKHRGENFDRNKNKDERNRSKDQRVNNTDTSEKHRNDKSKEDKDRKGYEERNRDERNDRNKDEKEKTWEDRNRKDDKGRNRDDRNRTKQVRDEEDPRERARNKDEINRRGNEQVGKKRNKNITREKDQDRDENIRINKVNKGKDDHQSAHDRDRSPVYGRTDKHERQNREFDSANKSQKDNHGKDRQREERDRDRRHRAEKPTIQNKHREKSRSREGSREKNRKESNHHYLGDSSDDVEHTKNSSRKNHSAEHKYDDKNLNYNSHKSQSKDKESARLESRNNSKINDSNEKDASKKRSRTDEKEMRVSKRKRKEETSEENTDSKKSKYEKSAKKRKVNEKKLEKKTKTRKKRRKDSTSSDSESSSSTSSSSSSTSSSSDSDRRKKRVRRKKRKHLSSTSSSSSSSTSSSSDSSSDSSSSSSDSDARKKKTKNSKKRLVKKTKKK